MRRITSSHTEALRNHSQVVGIRSRSWSERKSLCLLIKGLFKDLNNLRTSCTTLTHVPSGLDQFSGPEQIYQARRNAFSAIWTAPRSMAKNNSGHSRPRRRCGALYTGAAHTDLGAEKV